jgi:signal peptidase I
MSMKLREHITGFAKEVVLLACVVLLINSFVMASFQVPTGSMEDTVKIGDFLFVNKFIYGGSTPYTVPFTTIRIPHLRVPGFRGVARGDVIVFDWPGNRDQVEKPAQMWYLKRCIGLPGDTIRIENRVVYVNGRVFPNPPHSKFLRPESVPRYLTSPMLFPAGAHYNEDNYGPIVIPRKGMKVALETESLPAWEVFIRREGHSVQTRDGKVFIDGREAVGYTVERDYVFAMGDNRDNSLDSRFWGFVPVKDIIGAPVIVYWSWDPEIPPYDIFRKLASLRLRRIGQVIR